MATRPATISTGGVSAQNSSKDWYSNSPQQNVFGDVSKKQKPIAPGSSPQQIFSKEQLPSYFLPNREDVNRARELGIPTAVTDTADADQSRLVQQQLAQALMARNYNGAQTTANQNAVIDQAMGVASGTGPNPALDQLRQTTAQNVQGAAAAAASARGVNPGLAARIAATVGANANQTAAGQAAVQAGQQQLAGISTAGGLLNEQANQTLGYNQLLAQALQNQRGQDITQQATTAQAGLGLLGARAQNEQIIQDSLQRQYATQSGLASAGAAADASIVGGAIQGLATAGAIAASDEDVKEFHGSADRDIRSFLDAVSAHKYSYKGEMKDSPVGGRGEYVGPTAQELEKSAVGKGMVKDTPDGKVVDYGHGLGAMLAATASLHKRLDKLENGKKMSKGGKVEGKASRAGNSTENDTVPAMLSPGEIVVPRTEAADPDRAKAFIDHVMSQKRGRATGFSALVQRRRELAQELAQLDRKMEAANG